MKRSNIVFIIILGLIMFGCSSSWHVQKAREKCPECFKSDTIIEEVVFTLDTIIQVDTTINVVLPRDTARVEIKIPYLKPINIAPIYQKNGIIHLTTWVKNGIIYSESHLDSSMIYDLEFEIHVKDSIIRDQKVVINNQYDDIEKKDKWINKVKKWGKIGIITLGVIVIFLIVAIIIRILKWIKKK